MYHFVHAVFFLLHAFDQRMQTVHHRGASPASQGYHFLIDICNDAAYVVARQDIARLIVRKPQHQHMPVRHGRRYRCARPVRMAPCLFGGKASAIDQLRRALSGDGDGTKRIALRFVIKKIVDNVCIYYLDITSVDQWCDFFLLFYLIREAEIRGQASGGTCPFPSAPFSACRAAGCPVSSPLACPQGNSDTE